uniref:Homeobox-containing protein n=1 Tax=Parastrongyloides trichosuri TaxID=131310 RepID=A0A0N4ZBC8_PARTI
MLSPVIRNGMQLYKTNNYNHQNAKNLKKQSKQNFKNSNNKVGMKQKSIVTQNTPKNNSKNCHGSKNNITVLEKITEGEELDTSDHSQSQNEKEIDETKCCIFYKKHDHSNESKNLIQRFTITCSSRVHNLYYRWKNRRKTISENFENEKYTTNEKYKSEKIPYIVVEKNDVSLLN